jgi:DNA-binding transcriptional MocR family regulator
MDPLIDLRLNYPVLPVQSDYFKNSFTRHFGAYSDWLSIKPFRGSDAHRDLAATWLSREGEKIDRDRLSVVTGGHHGVLVAILAAGLSGKVIVADEFTYPNFKELAGLMGIQLVRCIGDADGMMPDSLKRVATKFSASGVYLMPTLHNPVGYVMPVERRLQIIEVARNLGMVIIEDDAYGFLEAEPPLKFAQLDPVGCWYICSMSKPLAPDIKVGYVVSPLSDVSAVGAAIKLSSSNPSSLFSSYISELIGNGELDLIISEKRQEGRKRREAAQNLLTGWNARGHENGWHLWVETPEGIGSDELSSAVTLEGVLISQSSMYRIGEWSGGSDFFRISLGGESDFRRVVRGIEIIADNFRRLAS